MTLHGRRVQLRDLAEAEARGQSFWTDEFEAGSRIRLSTLLGAMLDNRGVANAIATSVGQRMRLELGYNLEFPYWSSLESYLERECPGHLMPSLIEACFAAIGGDDGLASLINEILAEQRISFELINGEMVEFESKELHQEVVAPTLRLLSGKPGWDKAESAYQDALKEIAAGHAADSITDAGTALQEALMAAGCGGNSLGPLLKSARQKGLLAAHDNSNLSKGILQIAEWVSADRSTTGDSHRAGTSATRPDAWFTVHVVGALILRLAGGPRA